MAHTPIPRDHLRADGTIQWTPYSQRGRWGGPPPNVVPYFQLLFPRSPFSDRDLFAAYSNILRCRSARRPGERPLRYRGPRCSIVQDFRLELRGAVVGMICQGLVNISKDCTVLGDYPFDVAIVLPVDKPKFFHEVAYALALLARS
jgi:hypothetical protein